MGISYDNSGCGCDGTVEASHSTKVKARKEHRCCECRATINKGELYQREGVVFEGTARTYKTCSKCKKLRQELITLIKNWWDPPKTCLFEDMIDLVESYPSLMEQLTSETRGHTIGVIGDGEPCS